MNSLDDIAKYGLKSIDEVVNKAKITSLLELKRIGISSVDDLMTLGVTTAKDLPKLGIHTMEDLAELGIKNVDDFVEAGLSTLDNANMVFEGASGAGKTISADELKKIGTLGDNSGIRHVKGTEINAKNLFDNQVIKSTVKEVQSGVFVGQGADGFTCTFRAVSKSGPPTIDINGISGLRKIKFLP